MIITEKPKNKKRTRDRQYLKEPAHWWQFIQPRNAALLGEGLAPFHFLLKNHGAHIVRLRTSRGDDVEVSPGQVRMLYVEEDLRVDNHGETPVLIEFDFVPANRLRRQ